MTLPKGKQWDFKTTDELFEDCYIAKWQCTNCGNEGDVHIRRGIAKGEIDLSDLSCRNCWCKRLTLPRPKEPS